MTFSTALLSGLALYFNKFAVAVVNPYIFTGLKNILVALLLILLIYGWGKHAELKRLTKKQWGSLVTIGLVGGSIPFLLFFKGLTLTSAVQGAFIHKTLFIWAAIMAVIFLRERISHWSILGLVSLVGGLVLVTQVRLVSIGLGDALILIATILWSGEQIFAKKALTNISPLVVAWGRMFFGLIVIVGFWTVSGQLPLVAGISISQIGWVMFTAALLFGYVLTWYSGLKKISVVAATSILALGFPITTLIQVIIDGRSITVFQIMGLLLATTGAIVVLAFQRTRGFKTNTVQR